MMVFKADTLTSNKHEVIVEAYKRDDQLQMLTKVISDDRGVDIPLDVHSVETYEMSCQHIME